MGYVEQNLTKNETIVKRADKNPIALVCAWFFGIVFFFLLLIPTIKAIKATIAYCRIDLAVTNKRVVGRYGILHTESLDLPLNKVQSVNVTQGLGGKIFNYGSVEISSAAGTMKFGYIKKADAFKNLILAQADQFEEDRMKQQASQMAQAMAGALRN